VLQAPPNSSTVEVPPAYLWVPERSGTYGDEVADLARSVGQTFDLEQELLADALLSVNGNDWAALEQAVIAARQNLKTHTIEHIVLHGLTLMAEPLIVWSAHEFITAQESFRHFDGLFTNIDWLRRRVKKVSRGNGEEEFELLNGSRLLFKARSKSGGRGLSGSTVVLDEAFALKPAIMGALLPALSAKPNPRAIYGSSAGRPESGVLRELRDRGRAGGDPSLIYAEWCAPTGGCQDERCDHDRRRIGCAADRRENVQAANPAAGRRITWRYLAAERRALPAGEFVRERLGWWDDPADETDIDITAWDDLADPESSRATGLVLAFDASPGLRSAAIVAAGWRADGLWHVEVVAAGAGTEWVPAKLAQLRDDKDPDKVVCSARGPVSAIVPKVEKAGVEVEQLGDLDMAAGLVAFERDVDDAAGAHLGDEILHDALLASHKRDVGDGLVILSRKRSEAAGGDICAIVAVVAALRGLETVPKEPEPLVAWR
jgi:hypothetical protein